MNKLMRVMINKIMKKQRKLIYNKQYINKNKFKKLMIFKKKILRKLIIIKNC